MPDVACPASLPPLRPCGCAEAAPADAKQATKTAMLRKRKRNGVRVEVNGTDIIRRTLRAPRSASINVCGRLARSGRRVTPVPGRGQHQNATTAASATAEAKFAASLS